MTRTLQVSLVPGVSTNGLNSAQYFNMLSLNLLAGISGGNSGIEVGVISNASTFRVRGIQIAGVANVVGTNAFIVEPDDKLRARDEEKFTANFKGLQFSGILNYVNENAEGLQASGLFNATHKSFRGAQLGGFGNTAGGPTNGIQIAGVYNISGDVMSGWQVSGLFNVTMGYFSGTQISLINSARATSGKNTTPPTRARGMQVGLININKQMDGLQLGLFNIAGKGRGVQFGLINLYRAYPSKDNVNQGIPIGLLNFGSRGSRFRIYNSEMFPASIEYTTGQCRNCSATESEMPYNGNNQIYYHNSIIVGTNPLNAIWAFGYGFQRLMYNKAVMYVQPANRKRLMAYGVRFRYLYDADGNNTTGKTNSFNLLSAINFDYGKRLGRFHLYVSATFNHFIFQGNSFKGLPGWSKTIHNDEKGKTSQAFWPGYGVGVVF